MSKTIISTDKAPKAIGTYSQAVKAGNTVYMSGQIPLIPETMEVHSGDFRDQTRQVFTNLHEVARAAGGSLEDAVKLNIYLTDLGKFAELNEVMAEFFTEPYPARAAVEVAGLPKGVPVEIEGTLVLSDLLL